LYGIERYTREEGYVFEGREEVRGGILNFGALGDGGGEGGVGYGDVVVRLFPHSYQHEFSSSSSDKPWNKTKGDRKEGKHTSL
jgi:hypothetical protein